MTDDRSRQRLGRGLASLIGSGPAPARPASLSAGQNQAPAIAPERHLPIASIAANPNNPRRRFSETELGELANSIRHHGIVQPLLVRPRAGVADGFELVAGERRLRAAQKAGLTEVPVVVRDINDRQSLEIAIIENVQRAELDAVEEALGYQKLVDEHGYTQADLAEVLGKSRSHVANTLRLLKLPEDVREMVSGGRLSPGAARTLVGLDDPVGVARAIVERGFSVRQAEELARGGGDLAALDRKPARPPRSERPGTTDARKPETSDRGGFDKSADAGETAPAAPRQKDADALALENLLSEALGMPVEIEVEGETGSIRITYRDLQELDEICGLLQARIGHRPRDGEPKIHRL